MAQMTLSDKETANYESMPCREHMQGFFIGIR